MKDKKLCPHCRGYFAPQGYARWHGDNCIHRVTESRDIPWGSVATLFVAASIAIVSAWYSILGLITIFAGAAFEVAVMATCLEVGKVFTAGWLHLRWSTVPLLLRSYLVGAVIVLMFITSIGVFGFLSKAHIEHTINAGGSNVLQVEMLERRINTEKRNITTSETVLNQLDKSVQVLIDYDRIRGDDGAIAVRNSQKDEREALNNSISTSTDAIEELQMQLLPLKSKALQLEADVGPLKYIAEMIYGDTSEEQLGQAVRLLILLLVFVMDPLAVLLTIAGLMGFKHEEKIVKKTVDAMIME